MLSVLLCTHNPRPDYLAATVEGLRSQALATTERELLVIDNASAPGFEPAATSLGIWLRGRAGRNA